MRTIRLTSLIALLAVQPAVTRAQKFYLDDPITTEEQIDVRARPAAIELSDIYDRLANTLHDFGDASHGEAENVNTLDEVPDSPWFVNRHGQRRSSLAALVRGPNTSSGPNPSRPWTIVKGKSQGVTPGFEIVEEEGDRYVIKLDPVGVPELSSAAEVIATKIFHALGYFVPENYIVRVHPDNLIIGRGTRVEDRFGDEVELTSGRLRRLLRDVPRLPDGRIRVTASKYLDGEALGPFRYHGTRTDDPNDLVPHENRRELRGLRLFAAWLNHDDSRAHNTQDVWVHEGAKRLIRHYLIDFGSAFGSGTVDLQLPNLSFHYWLDFDLMKKNALGLGLHVPTYRKVEWPNFPEYRSVGRWESTYFDPGEWKPDYPNPAFTRMTARDAFWAAKGMMRFSPDELRALVRTGELSDPEEEDYFVDTLVERQRKSGRFGITGVNPLDEFRVSGLGLSFTNLAERYGFVESATAYRVSWFVYDNELDRRTTLGRLSTKAQPPVRPKPGLRSVGFNTVDDVAGSRWTRPGSSTRTTASSIRTGTLLESRARIPHGYIEAQDERYLVAEIHSLNDDYPRWNTPVRVYLRFADGGYEIVGIERVSPALSLDDIAFANPSTLDVQNSEL